MHRYLESGQVRISLFLKQSRWYFTACLILLLGYLAPTLQAVNRDYGAVEYETRSHYSHIRIRRNGTVRTMVFVRDSGEEACESQVDLNAPHVLRFPYLKSMFANYLLQPTQSKALIVGLGGGSMVYFLQKYHPDVYVEAVEIDPVVAELAERFFAFRQGRNVRLLVADAFDYLRKSDSRYDTIYIDAFLKPSDLTDDTGVPLVLRTFEFYRLLQSHLTEGGSVVFNINPHSNMEEDIEGISDAFPQAYVFDLPHSEGVVVVGSMLSNRIDVPTLKANGERIDAELGADFSFVTIASHLRSRAPD